MYLFPQIPRVDAVSYTHLNQNTAASEVIVVTVIGGATSGPVSYTHLDVYKRQLMTSTGRMILSAKARLLQWPHDSCIIILYD